MEKAEKIGIAVGSVVGTALIILPVALYYDGLHVHDHNDTARKQLLLPMILKYEPEANSENIKVIPYQDEGDCPLTDHTEPVKVIYKDRVFGEYCLSRSIDNSMRETLWEAATPISTPYKYNSARKL